MPTQQQIKRELREVDRKFRQLDTKRVQATADGDYEETQRIDKEQERLHTRGEDLRGMLGR